MRSTIVFQLCASGNQRGWVSVSEFMQLMPCTPRVLARRALTLFLLLLAMLSCSKLGADASGQDSFGERHALPSNAHPSQAPPSASPRQRSTAVLAGGCFWGMEEILRKVPGVLETEVGYTGGKLEGPRYSDVSSGNSGHAEAVRVVFDPTRLSYRDLLEKWFFRMHDPTTKDRQGNDVGTQYRSAIFVSDPEQRRIATEVIRQLDQSGKFSDPIVTTIERAGTFTPAEEYHQDYLRKNPGGYTCHYLREWT